VHKRNSLVHQTVCFEYIDKWTVSACMCKRDCSCTDLSFLLECSSLDVSERIAHELYMWECIAHMREF